QHQKALFLIGRNMPDLVGPEFYAFEPYNYGPFDAGVFDDARALARRGLAVETQHPRSWNRYAPTPAGVAAGEKLAEENIPHDARRYVKDVVAWVRSLSFRDLVRAIYDAYPDTKARSIFRG